MRAKNFTLEKYLERIQYQDNIERDLQTLKKLHLQHLLHIPFENLDVMAKKEISLVPEKIVEKILENKRGGYCYEVNALFAMALEAIGFQYTMLCARPKLNYNTLRPKTHMLLKVEINKKSYICDVGFGGYGVLEPIELKDNIVEKQLFDSFQLTRREDIYTLSSKMKNGWEDLYTFDLYPQQWIDYTLANYFNSHSHETIFTNRYITTKVTKEHRVFLLDNTLKFVTSESTHEEEIQLDERKKVLKEIFDITL